MAIYVQKPLKKSKNDVCGAGNMAMSLSIHFIVLVLEDCEEE